MRKVCVGGWVGGGWQSRIESLQVLRLWTLDWTFDLDLDLDCDNSLPEAGADPLKTDH